MPDTPREIIKAYPTDAGCYVDGHWGQYAVAHMIERATEWGYTDKEVEALADKHMAHCRSSGAPMLTLDESEALSGSSQEVENWLNEHVAPEGYSFGWYDGEFFLQSSEWWDE